MSRFVHQTEFTTLYHYEPFVSAHLISTLQDRKIHCSSPDNFNDPWDCKPEFDPSCADDEAAFTELIEWFHSQAKVTLPEHLKQQLGNRLWSDPRERLKFLRDFSQSHIQIISQRRIYCLSAVNNDILMWSHYTDKHKGICFEFDINNQLMGAAFEIIYSDEYRIWHPHEFQKNQSRAIEMVLTKSSQWKYEKEFRITGLLSSPVASYLMPEGDFFHLPPSALKSIIAGCAADYETIKKIVVKYMPDLPIKRAMRVHNLYKLVIDE